MKYSILIRIVTKIQLSEHIYFYYVSISNSPDMKDIGKLKMFFFRYVGFKVLGLWVLRFLGLLVLKFLGLWVLKCFGLWVLKVLGLWVLKCLGMWVLRF